MDSPLNHDKDSKNSLLISETPLTHLRRYTDAMIGSLLQSFIGLPSAFTQRDHDHGQLHFIFNGPNPSDEFKTSRHSVDDNALNMQISSDEVEIPVKKYRNRVSTTGNKTSADESSHSTGWDLPLYSPVSRTLFANFLWQDINQMPGSHLSTMEADNFFPFCPYSLNKKSVTKPGNPDTMKIIRTVLFHELKKSDNFSSKYSLIPYLSFSPYSPLKLSNDSRNNPKDADFPYCLAFQDLVETSFGNVKRITNEDSHEDFSPLNIERKFDANLFCPFSWIEKLYDRGLLQEKKEKFLSCPMSRASFFPFPFHEKSSFPPTELDTYHPFSDKLSPPFGDRKFHDFFPGWILGSFNEERENIWERPQKYLNDTESDDSFENRNNRVQVDKAMSISPENPEQVVSSSTLTTRRLGEDGKFYTSIEVRKIYADGRQTVSTSSHIDAQIHENQDQEFSVASKNRDSQKLEESKTESPKKRNHWFWRS